MGKRAGFRLQPVLELRRMQEKAAAQAAADAAHTAAEADRRATEREDALVGAAQRAMLEHGADAKLVHVAEAAGLTSGAVLYHFPDVQALLLEANRAGMERFYDERVAALRDVVPGLLPAAWSRRSDGRALTALGVRRIGTAEAVVVPALAVDRRGVRLGRGGGYYDRFLVRYAGETLLLCRQALLRPDIPWEAHDVLIPAVITEQGTPT